MRYSLQTRFFKRKPVFLNKLEADILTRKKAFFYRFCRLANAWFLFRSHMSLITLIDILLLAVLLLYSRVYFSSPIDATRVTEKTNTAVYLLDIYAQIDDSSNHCEI
jgi:hypothetical protein